MKKTYKIDVDCANCANKMEEAAKNTAGVKDATVNFMMLKMIVEFEDGQDPKAVMKDVLKNCKKVEDLSLILRYPENGLLHKTYPGTELFAGKFFAAVLLL